MNPQRQPPMPGEVAAAPAVPARWPDFDHAVPDGGYAWWYLDALSDDGQQALVAIAFIGSVFSPYYAAARRRQGASAVPAQQHVAVNLALYRTGRSGSRDGWTMTERGQRALQRSAQSLTIGPSQWRWHGDALELQVDEHGLPWPWPTRVRGRIRLHPLAFGTPAPLALDGAAALHHWWPIAPCARVEVDLPLPGWRWRGSGYLDSNRGAVPIEQGFAHWQWARAAIDGRHSAVVYDAELADGSSSALALRFDASGRVQAFDAPPLHPLPPSGWRLPRALRSAAGAVAPQVQRTLQDAPFYARSLVQANWLGRPVLAMHESLQLRRLVQPAVQAMLPFRMPRRAG
jgi:carotenoid 1,2-hydratase